MRTGRIGVLVTIIVMLASGSASADGPNTWSPGGPVVSGRSLHVGALLQNGRVLIAGGIPGTTTPTDTAELYDPATNAFTGVHVMNVQRAGAAAVTLPNGHVLVLGGSSAALGGEENSAEVYDPGANTWTPVANLMSSPRGNLPMAVLLRSGQVLVAGGADGTGTAVNSADLYSPATNKFASTGPMGVKRVDAMVTLLASGKVLVAGGVDQTDTPLASAEVYDPSTGTWTAVANTMSSPRTQAGAALLPSGKVVLAGGVTGPSSTTATTDIYDPASNSFSPGPPMNEPRAAFGIASLPSGDVFVTGGLVVTSGGGVPIDGTAQIYNPAADAWVTVAPLPVRRTLPVTVVLQDGRVLVDGGGGDLQPRGLADAELFTPPTPPGAPGNVTAVPGDGTAIVSFSPPSDGGLPILHYTVTASTGQTSSTTDGRTFATVGGLATGRPVTFTVTATNALGTGAASAPSAAVTPVSPPPPDRAATLRLTGVPRTLRLKAFLKGVRFSITPSKATALQILLLASASRATLARAFDLTLASRSLRLSAATQRITLKPSRKLVGHPKRITVELVIVATDAAGTRSSTTRSFSVRRSAARGARRRARGGGRAPRLRAPARRR